MSRIRANTIVNGAGTGAPNFPRGAIISGISTINAEISVGTGTSISSPATNTLTLGTNNTEKVRITSAGLVGIGTDAPNQKLHIHADGTSYVRFTDESSGTSATDGAIFGLDGTNLYAWNYEAGDFVVATSGNNKFTVKDSGNIEIPDGNLVVASGHGIDFSNSGDGTGTVDSELLDEYEEGTFTPTIVNGFSSANFQYNGGRYTRIGNVVYCDIYLRFDTGATANGGPIQIGNLPFTISNKTYGTGTGGSSQWTRGLGHTSFQNLQSNSQIVHFYGAAPQNYFSCYIKGDQSWQVTTSAGGANGAYIIGAFQYQAD